LEAAVKVAVVGGGIAGLSAAYELHKSGAEFTLFESSERLGGVIRTERVGDFLMEAGPDSWLSEKSAARELCSELGLDGDLIGSNDSRRKTYVLLGKKLVPLPDGLQFFVPTDPAATFFSPLFPLKSKIGCMREWLAGARKKNDEDESIADFVSRHFGEQIVERLAEPLLAGVYGGHPRELSAQAVLPRMVKMESERESLIRGMMTARKNSSGARPAIFTSLRGGMQAVVDGLVRKLPPSSLMRKCEVREITRGETWKVRVNDAASDFDALVIALPAPNAGNLLQSTAPEIAGQLRAIRYSSSVIVQFAYAQTRAPKLPPGFGVLVPRTENRRVRAITFVHEKFDGRVPSGGALIRMFLGGTGDEAVLRLSDEEISAIGKRELLEILNIREEPVAVRVFRWPVAMAQYEVGHLRRLEIIRRQLAEMPTLGLAGNAYGGIGVPDCIRSGRDAALKVMGKK
jgi:protoporphyrinogen/coproporphyrinogen III oxidase